MNNLLLYKYLDVNGAKIYRRFLPYCQYIYIIIMIIIHINLHYYEDQKYKSF